MYADFRGRCSVRPIFTFLAVFFVYPNLLIGPVVTVALIAALIKLAVGH